jgi:uncharacterized GH25 family protein
MKTFIVLLLTVAFSSAIFAHDFCLYPSTFRIKEGSKIKVAIHVDDVFPGKHAKWNSARVLRFEHWLGTQKTDLSTVKSLPDSSGVNVKVEQGGTHLFALDWSARLIELKPDLFNQYLSAEGLEHILALRAERGEENKPGRERYSRYVKTLIDAGFGNEEALTSIVGQTIELVPLENPYRKTVGDSLRVKLLFRGQPLNRALISATFAGFTEKPDTYAYSAKTDSEGIVTIPLTKVGPWLVRSVYMLPLTDSTEADYESWWASLTFEIR